MELGGRKESFLLFQIRPRTHMAVHTQSVDLVISTAFWF